MELLAISDPKYLRRLARECNRQSINGKLYSAGRAFIEAKVYRGKLVGRPIGQNYWFEIDPERIVTDSARSVVASREK